MELPPTCFFSLTDLLAGLLARSDTSGINVDQMCTFVTYCNARTSHARLPVENSLIENEIGGVIMGSLTAAVKRGGLCREEYLAEKRSNVSNATDEGLQTRSQIFDIYEQYKGWKEVNGKHDINDVVLVLLNKNLGELFQSGACVASCLAYTKGIFQFA
jgi:hypothetical protein